VSAVAGNTTASVSFIAPVSNGGSAITGYTVTSSPAGGVDSNAGSTLTTHAITGLANGTSYTFTVTAANLIGSSVPSAASTAVIPVGAPGQPTGVNAVPGNAQATVSFSAPASNGGAAITGYTVTSNPGGGVDANAGSTALTHTITSLTNGQAYTFTVTATNAAAFTSAASAASVAVTPGPPPNPTSFTATATMINRLTTQVVLNWQESAALLTGFTIQRALDPAFTLGLATITVGAAPTTYTDTNLSRTKTYYYRIQAYNVAGTSAWVNLSVTTP
jgi:hypothetical protein